MTCIELNLWGDSFESNMMSSTSVSAYTEASPAPIGGGINKTDIQVESVFNFDLSDEEDFSQACLRAGFARGDIMANPCHRCPFEGLCDADGCAALLFNTDVASREYDHDAAEESYLSFLY